MSEIELPSVAYDTMIPKVYLDRTKMIIHCIQEHSNACLNPGYELTTGFMSKHDAIDFADKLRMELNCQLFTWFKSDDGKMIERGWKEKPIWRTEQAIKKNWFQKLFS